jgi:hypothetical protein
MVTDESLLEALDELISPYFGSYSEYISLPNITETDIVRLATWSGDLVITRAWATDYSLEGLGHRPNHPIEIFNTQYQSLATFPPAKSWGTTLAHITFIQSLRHGQAYYLKISTLLEVKVTLCIACTRLSNRVKSELISTWQRAIPPKLPQSGGLFLHYPGTHDFIVIYNPAPYSAEITILDIKDSSKVILTQVTDTIYLPAIQEGYYGIGLVEGEEITWLKIINPKGKGEIGVIATYGVNYVGYNYLNRGLNSIPYNKELEKLDETASNFSLTGDLTPAFSEYIVDLLAINPPPTSLISTSIL